MNVRTVINGTNNNKCNKCNNKAQRNNECTVSRTVLDWKMFTFRLGSHVFFVFFLFEFFENRVFVRGQSNFHLAFSV